MAEDGTKEDNQVPREGPEVEDWDLSWAEDQGSANERKASGAALPVGPGFSETLGTLKKTLGDPLSMEGALMTDVDARELGFEVQPSEPPPTREDFIKAIAKGCANLGKAWVRRVVGSCEEANQAYRLPDELEQELERMAALGERILDDDLGPKERPLVQLMVYQADNDLQMAKTGGIGDPLEALKLSAQHVKELAEWIHKLEAKNA